MFEEIPFILGYILVSVVVSYILFHYTPEPLSKIIEGLAIIGLIFHELCHIFLCIISRVPIENAVLIKKLKAENNVTSGYYGEVKVSEYKISFLQAFLVSFAPLYLSFWLFFILLNFLIENRVTPLIFFLSIFTMISITLYAAPSFADLSVIPKAFESNPSHSSYQILLIAISVLITWLLLTAYRFQPFHEIIIYLIIAGIYFVVKYSFIIIRKIFQSDKLKKKDKIIYPYQFNTEQYLDRKYNPQKRHKERINGIRSYADFFDEEN